MTAQLFHAPPHSAERDERYTPEWIFRTMNLRFDVDVATIKGGVPYIPARRHYSIEDDGLAQEWKGRVWMNPPYSGATPWVMKFIEHGHGIALVGHAKSAWHPALWAACDGAVVPTEYFDFVGGSIFMPVWFAAFGEECVEAISRLGVVRRAT